MSIIFILNRLFTEYILNKANASGTKAAVLDLNLSFYNDTVSTKIYDKRDHLINYPYNDGDVTQHHSYGAYISQLIRFARTSSHVGAFNSHNKQGYRYYKLPKTFSKFYHIKFELSGRLHA